MASERCAILTREGYVERIHDCWRGQGMSAATHDVLMHHDAALRAEVEGEREEREEACALLDKMKAERDRLREALREIADNPLPAETGYECAWCNGVRKHHKECPCSRATAALKREKKP